MKVLLLSRYSNLGASSRIRNYQYIPYLEAHGFCITVAPLLDDEYIKRLYAGERTNWWQVFASYCKRLRYLLASRPYDLIWIEKELFPFAPVWAEVLLSRMHIPFVVDYDDAVFHRYDMNANRLVRILLRSKIDAVMRQSSMVIVGNEYLAERARRAGARKVEYLPSVIDLEQYTLAPQRANKIFTIGWIGNPVTAKYIHLISPALAQVCRGGRGRLVLIGSGQIELDGVPTEIRPWSEKTEIEDLQRFDVGIMPLPDEPWERGKCGFKLIQYMACGKPVVASPVGVNEQIVEDGVNGFLAPTKDKWVRALNSLRDDLNLRERMGIASRKRVEANYCVQVTDAKMAALLSLAGNGKWQG
jgi:glycosyltransferase involved in cell wall biosynthesis